MSEDDVCVKEGESLLFLRPGADYRIRIDKVEKGHVWLTAIDKKGRRKRDDTVENCQKKINHLFLHSIVHHKKGNQVLKRYHPY